MAFFRIDCELIREETSPKETYMFRSPDENYDGQSRVSNIRKTEVAYNLNGIIVPKRFVFKKLRIVEFICC
jgi:hypothetical protein